MKPAMRLYTTIIITLVVCVQLGYTDEGLPAMIKQVKPSVVTVIGYDSDNKEIRQGSGFFIPQFRPNKTKSRVSPKAY